MAILTFVKGSEAWVSRNFQAREFDCPCEHCGETLIDEDLVELLQRFRRRLGVPLKITSGFRCEWYHEDLGRRGYETAKKSTHLAGQAIDCKTGIHSGAELELAARACGFESVGVGQFFIHADTRKGYRRWTYAKR